MRNRVIGNSFVPFALFAANHCGFQAKCFFPLRLVETKITNIPNVKHTSFLLTARLLARLQFMRGLKLTRQVGARLCMWFTFLCLALPAAPGAHAQSTNWLSGTNIFSLTYGTTADSDAVDGATLIVTNGASLTAGQLNVGPTNAAVLKLYAGASISVQTLQVTNVVCGGTTNSIFNFNGGTLTTSNGSGSGYAANILLASNASWTINGNWNLNGGTNLICNAATNSNPAALVYFGSGMNNLQLNVNSNAAWWSAIPANSFATNIPSLVIGYNNATNNVAAINNGTLIATNYNGLADPILVGYSAGSTGNQLLITNGGQVFTRCYGNGGLVGGMIGNSGNNNSAVVTGANGAGRKAAWNLGADRLQIGNGAAINSWVRVDQGGVITNAVIMMWGNYSSLLITNGGQFFCAGATVGRSGFNDSLVVGSNKATLTFYNSGSMTVGGGSVSANNPGTNNTARVDAGGLITNLSSMYVGGNGYAGDTNCIANTLVITNGGQVSSTAACYIGTQAGCNTNSASIGGGSGLSVWDFGAHILTIGNTAKSSNNCATLFAGGLLMNLSSVILGGANSRLNFNGGALAAGSSGSLINTNSTALNAASFVQVGGAVIDDGGFAVTLPLPLLQDPNSAGGGLTKLGSGTLTLVSPNTYAGPTTIRTGTLALSGSGSLASSPIITVAGGATFDNSALAAPFTLGAGQTLSNSTIGASLAGSNNCSAGIVSLVYDGTNASFIVTNGAMTLSAGTVFNLNNLGPTLGPGGYPIIANVSGSAGGVGGTVPTNVTYSGGSLAGAPSLHIILGGLYLGVGGNPSAFSYSPTTFQYNGAAQSPTISFIGSTGTRTTNYVGVAPTSYGPSTHAPTNVGTYCVANTVATDANFLGASNSTLFTIQGLGNLNPAKVVIIKCDDFRVPSLAWTNLLQVTRTLGIKVGLGVICTNGIDTNTAARVPATYQTTTNWMNSQETIGDVEFWNHAWDHTQWTNTGGQTVSEYSGSGLAYMQLHMAESQDALSNALGHTVCSFGTAYNGFDTNTAIVINATPALRLFFASSVTTVRNGGLNASVAAMGIISESDGTGLPNSTKFATTYPGGPAGPVSLQFHPASFVNNSGTNSLLEFQKIMQYLQTNGYAILKPSEYIAALPAFTNQPLSQSIPVGASVTFAVGATGNEPLRYQWLFNGAPSAGAIAASLTLTNLQATNAGNYSVVITNAFGSATSSVAVLTTILKPVLAANTNRSLMAGATLWVTNSATDPNSPSLPLGFALPVKPVGAGINTASGVVNWRPAISQGGTSNQFTVVVTNQASLAATQSFWVGVIAPQKPGISPPLFSAKTFRFTITGDAGPDYTIQGATNLASPSWQTLFFTNAPALPFTWADTNTTPAQIFYRILLGP